MAVPSERSEQLELFIRCLASDRNNRTSIVTTRHADIGPKSISSKPGSGVLIKEIVLFMVANKGNKSNTDERMRTVRDIFLNLLGINALKKIGETNNKGIGNLEMMFVFSHRLGSRPQSTITNSIDIAHAKNRAKKPKIILTIPFI